MDELIPGTLYLVATPIGNLKDWSVRAQEILAGVDIVLAEDTRVTGLLCHNAGIAVRLLSFHAHNTRQRIPEVISQLQQGHTLALVSDRGMPAISDPGQELVEAIWAHGLHVSVIPGPSAAITAFAASGFPAPFGFWGFLPRHGEPRRRVLAEIAQWPYAAVVFESPHHMDRTLMDLNTSVGICEIVLGREMTKRHEEYWRGSLQALVETPRSWQGECVLVIGPRKKIPGSSEVDWPQLVSRVERMIEQGMHPNDAIRQVARDNAIDRRELYQRLHGY
ncbi:MAG: 16S rRNA (cytidine(1402)-2'-O)-methyltransferase [Sulfobacillus acidophilus]|uniref:Ribosomal RNA small subunit methyltransferase I n=1 Tax=Sulfobacillus acidophilus TaxID=53633 RepID=A0A2T2WH77_9FIRM|nr:MAG: 16S rRNA (cytidine(1402)-2'-O)-methyltransferase [Sulfobacillus acidophilus]